MQQVSNQVYKTAKVKLSTTALMLTTCLIVTQGCTPQRVLNHGAIITQDRLDLVPVGSSRQQVELSLGSPSTTGTFENTTYYYISQKSVKQYKFQKPKLVDQRVVAIYFDENDTVKQVADYGLKDGRLFDFISRTTPTGGRDYTFLQQVLTGKASPAAVMRGKTDAQGGPDKR